MPAKRFQSYFLSSALALAALAGLSACDSSTGPAGTGPELAAGEYFIQNDQDDSYHYEQYFVVHPGYRWDFVEYGTTPGTKTLCQLTRQQGTYSATDSTLTITATAGGESVEKCGMAKADFDGYAFQKAPAGTTQTFSIRGSTAAGFEAKDLFQGTTGWKSYVKTADPFGFF